MKEKQYINEDEIDLKELFLTIWKYKIFVILFISFITILSIIYVVYIKKEKPTFYKGSLLVKVVEIKTENGLVPLDSTFNIKYIFESETPIKIVIPDGSSNLIKLNFENESKERIKNEILNIYKNIVHYQKEKLKFYNNYIDIKKIGNIKIEQITYKSKKRWLVIVSFITGLILAIFLVFFIEFIKSFKKEEK